VATAFSNTFGPENFAQQRLHVPLRPRAAAGGAQASPHFALSRLLPRGKAKAAPTLTGRKTSCSRTVIRNWSLEKEE